MYEVMQDYKSYLEQDCRYNYDTIVSYLGNLPIIFDNLKIQSITEIDAARIASEWKRKRWVVTEAGIEHVQNAGNRYMPALKAFLKFLEERNFPVESGLEKLIHLPDESPSKLAGMTTAEMGQLDAFLAYHINTDVERRDGALTRLMLDTGCTLAEAVMLRIDGGDTAIDTQSVGSLNGSFETRDDGVYVYFEEIGDRHRKVRLSDQTVHFINFYVENRARVSRFLFLNNVRKNLPRPLSVKSASRAIERIFRKAGIVTREGQAVAVLLRTAEERGVRAEYQEREVVSSADYATLLGYASINDVAALPESRNLYPHHRQVA